MKHIFDITDFPFCLKPSPQSLLVFKMLHKLRPKPYNFLLNHVCIMQFCMCIAINYPWSICNLIGLCVVQSLLIFQSPEQGSAFFTTSLTVQPIRYTRTNWSCWHGRSTTVSFRWIAVLIFSFLNNETSHISLCLPLPYLLSLKCYDISMCIFHAGSLCCYCIQSV